MPLQRTHRPRGPAPFLTFGIPGLAACRTCVGSAHGQPGPRLGISASYGWSWWRIRRIAVGFLRWFLSKMDNDPESWCFFNWKYLSIFHLVALELWVQKQSEFIFDSWSNRVEEWVYKRRMTPVLVPSSIGEKPKHLLMSTGQHIIASLKWTYPKSSQNRAFW